MKKGEFKVSKPFLVLTLFFWSQALCGMQSEAAQFAREKLLPEGTTTVHDVLFTMEKREEVEPTLVGLIDATEGAIKGAYFRLSNPHVVDAMIRAKQRGVEVDIVCDAQAVSSGGQLLKLYQAGIVPNIFDAPKSKYSNFPAFMHHKFTILKNTFGGKDIIASGSLNPSTMATKENFENVKILEDADFTEKFLEEHARLKAQSHFFGQDEIVKARKAFDRAIKFEKDKNIDNRLVIPKKEKAAIAIPKNASGRIEKPKRKKKTVAFVLPKKEDVALTATRISRRNISAKGAQK